MCEGCSWLWNSGVLDTTVGLVGELCSLEAGSDSHAIAWSLAKDNHNRVSDHIHRVLCEEVMEEMANEPLMQMMMGLLGEML